MAYSEQLAGRVRKALVGTRGIDERKMFGGIAFLYHGNMCVGVDDGRLMVRVGKEQYDRALKQKHAREMDFTGKPLRGFVFVEEEGLKTSAQMKKWVDMSLAFVKTLPEKY